MIRECLRKMSIRQIMLTVTGIMAALWFLGFGYCIFELKRLASVGDGSSPYILNDIIKKAMIDYVGTPILAFVI